jgi:predicted transcriptional regulator
MKFYTNMLSSMKLKVQEAAKKLRREETKIFKTLNKVEESGA